MGDPGGGDDTDFLAERLSLDMLGEGLRDVACRVAVAPTAEALLHADHTGLCLHTGVERRGGAGRVRCLTQDSKQALVRALEVSQSRESWTGLNALTSAWHNAVCRSHIETVGNCAPGHLCCRSLKDPGTACSLPAARARPRSDGTSGEAGHRSPRLGWARGLSGNQCSAGPRRAG